MLIHLGSGIAVHREDIIAAVDLTHPVSDDTGSLILQMRSSRHLTELSSQPKTMVLCSLRRGIFPNRTNEIHCFLSGVGLRTIVGRMSK